MCVGDATEYCGGSDDFQIVLSVYQYTGGRCWCCYGMIFRVIVNGIPSSSSTNYGEAILKTIRTSYAAPQNMDCRHR